MNKCDFLVIGGGPGGYVAAIRAAQLGLKVVCIDKRPMPGGTCLNVGCIPSKTLLHASEKFYEARHTLHRYGITISGEVHMNLEECHRYKDAVLSGLGKGIEFLFKKNNITYVKGSGSFKSNNSVEVTHSDGTTEIWESKNIIIATGSSPSHIDNILIDEDRVVSSTGALAFKDVPHHLIIVGGGYIGLEMGAVWSRLGSQITVIDVASKILPTMDHEISSTFQKMLEKHEFSFYFNSKILAVETRDNHIEVTMQTDDGNVSLIGDRMLISVGRSPYTKNLNISVDLDNRGFIKVDKNFRTSVDGVYAIGDVIGGVMLAHKAEEEGIYVAEYIAGKHPHINYDCIPGVVYTHPEIAYVGKTEQEIIKLEIPYKVGKFPFSANSRAKAQGEDSGFVKVIAHKDTDKILGVHIIGQYAGTMIGEAVLAMEYGASAEDIARTCHAHPTHNEALKEAAMNAYDRAIHS
jgi:dihydrolipoamide dehydrogenase